MVTTLNWNTEIPETRELKIKLPDEVPSGHAEIVMQVSTGVPTVGSTLGDLAASEFVGIWAERSDIIDSVSFAKDLREAAWRRK